MEIIVKVIIKKLISTYVHYILNISQDWNPMNNKILEGWDWNIVVIIIIKWKIKKIIGMSPTGSGELKLVKDRDLNLGV